MTGEAENKAHQRAGDRWKAKYSIPGLLRIAQAPGRSLGRTGPCQTLEPSGRPAPTRVVLPQATLVHDSF
jgi:hypothetical protein